MSLTSRILKLEKALTLPKQIQLQVIISGPDDPESVDEPGVHVIRVRLDADNNTDK